MGREPWFERTAQRRVSRPPHPKFPEEETYSSAQRLWTDAILSGVLCTRDRTRTLVRAHSAASWITIIHTLSFRRRKLTHQHSVCGQTQSCRDYSAREIGREPWFERTAQANQNTSKPLSLRHSQPLSYRA